MPCKLAPIAPFLTWNVLLFHFSLQALEQGDQLVGKSNPTRWPMEIKDSKPYRAPGNTFQDGMDAVLLSCYLPQEQFNSIGKSRVLGLQPGSSMEWGE
jgi:hypothetical protein